MIDINQAALDTWMSYYYASNSVGYIARNARNDLFASQLSRSDRNLLVLSIKESLSQPPSSPKDVILPYIYAAAAAMREDIKKEEIMSMDAPFSKWFHDYVDINFFKTCLQR